MGIHQRRTHPEPVEGCWACRVGAGPYVGAAVKVTNAGARSVVATDAKQRRWDRDMPAYKSLREDGLQPPRIDGSDELGARATHPDQINTGKLVNPRAFEAFQETFEHPVTEVAPTAEVA